jgi:hypothetical protein
MQRFVAILPVLCACVTPTVLEPGFEAEIVQGWVCSGGMVEPPDTGATTTPVPVSYTALDAGETFRVQASLPSREATFPAEETSPTSTYLRVYTGAWLIVDDGGNKCNDVVEMVGPSQRIDLVYSAVEGTARAVLDGGGVALELEGVVLRPDDVTLPDVVVDALLPAFP